MNKIESAISFALEAHSGSCRKDTSTPYILHPLEAAAIASSITNDEDVIAAAVLHDVIEDTQYGKDDIRARFGDRVLRLVLSATENKRSELPPEETWKIRKRETLDRIEDAEDDELIVLFSDKLANLRSIWSDYLTIWEDLWKRFAEPDPRKQLWYYGGIYSACSRLGSYPAYAEYGRKLREISGHVEEYEKFGFHDPDALCVLATPGENKWVFRRGQSEDLMIMTDEEFRSFISEISE